MKINGVDVKVEDLVDEKELEKGFLKDCGNGILLNDEHIDILNRYDIDYKKYSSVDQLLYAIDECLNDSYGMDTDDLEWVSSVLAERNYYQNTQK